MIVSQWVSHNDSDWKGMKLRRWNWQYIPSRMMNFRIWWSGNKYEKIAWNFTKKSLSHRALSWSEYRHSSFLLLEDAPLTRIPRFIYLGPSGDCHFSGTCQDWYLCLLIMSEPIVFNGWCYFGFWEHQNQLPNLIFRFSATSKKSHFVQIIVL